MKKPNSSLSILQKNYLRLILLIIGCLQTHLQADSLTAGIDAYHDGRFPEAIKAFEFAIAEAETAALRHNLALAHYQSGNPTEALWHLERARQLVPRKQDYALKLELLRQQLGLHSTKSSAKWSQLSHQLKPGEWIWIITLSFWACLLTILRRVTTPKSSNTAHQLSIATTAGICLLSLAALSMQKNTAPEALHLHTEITPLRHAPATAAPEAGPTRPGERLKIIKRHQDFIKVRTEALIEGWIPTSTIRPL